MARLDSPGPASEPAAPSVDSTAPPNYQEATQTFPAGFEQTVIGRRFNPQADPGGMEAAGPAAGFGSSSAAVFPSTSSEYKPIRLLNFSIEYRDRNVSLIVADTEVVGKEIDGSGVVLVFLVKPRVWTRWSFFLIPCLSEDCFLGYCRKAEGAFASGVGHFCQQTTTVLGQQEWPEDGRWRM